MENNYLSAEQTTSWLDKYKAASTDEERKKLVDVASKADASQQQKALNTQISKDYLVKQQDDLIKLTQSPGCDADCQKLAQYSINQLTPVIDNYDEMQRSNNIPKAAIATISLALPVLGRAVAPSIVEWAGSSTLVNRGISAVTSGAANAAVQGYSIYEDPKNNSFSWGSVGTAAFTGGITANMGLYNTVAINSGIAGVSSVIDGKSPWLPMTGAAMKATVGWYAGETISNKIDTKLNPWSKGFNERFNSEFPTISAPIKIDTFTPSIFGGAGGATGAEITNKLITDPFTEKGKK